MSFDNGFLLIYNDPRRFGFVETIVGDHTDYKRFKCMGIEPLSKEFDGKHLWFKIKNSSRTLKNILMDQRVVAGLGNIYVSEALWDSEIKPTAACHTNTRRKKNKGIKGRTSTVGAKALYASGSSANVLKKINTFKIN